MFDKSLTVSTTLIVYATIVCLTALFCFFYDIKRLFRVKPRLAPTWYGDWYHFGFFIWGIILIFLFAQRGTIDLLIRYNLVSGPYWAPIIAGAVTQVLMFAFIVLCYKKLPDLYPKNINSEDTCHGKAFLQGIFDCFAALPVIWLVGLAWGSFLTFLKKMGLPIEIKPQFIVEIFSKAESPALITTIFIMAACLAPMVEELIFRGGMYRFLKSKYSMPMAFGASALFFALLHFSLISSLPLFVMGLFLAKAYERTGNILTPMALHATFNLNTLVLLLIEPDLTLMQQSGFLLNSLF
ncbi:MAG: hypothetical protein COZ46_06215 [Verrucomicrobia bacterium CG_4_10_14_3_um_filter_43_23]|nr:MAG: hypothetical protein AUJ82_07935 [Verrucomicrobia bacterium CG1_02_43_26]PIP59365.1 MAG: hypothetical protein COX01_04150 [Verrucomicrobia bacterium CG22_combo_CG10-13_8_21_14_all_43_17]PIX57990.1 MAG: hypothetical protein COZ46_06215 [Verrucomicrobia bacterium CG_4_10_14_3_um_filter_43_23]PIY61279.1 MAG: hypothetical protein COY94_06150 [Verrucomicrobia bacterium CG_4_10_14_0_8_um_filter_43_34]PJA44258.1 MAG: hypothetical protein CO175_03840 [Verrucomicrobia bacterium CG_4_9_14_3_um_fi